MSQIFIFGRQKNVLKKETKKSKDRAKFQNFRWFAITIVYKAFTASEPEATYTNLRSSDVSVLSRFDQRGRHSSKPPELQYLPVALDGAMLQSGQEGQTVKTINFDNIPDELRQLRQWVLWKLENDEKGNPTKLPCQINGSKARSDDPSTWLDFESILNFYTDKGKNSYNGIGFMFSRNDPYCFIDLDHCIDENGIIEPESKRIVGMMNTYTEGSQGGHGLHVIGKAELPGHKGRVNHKKGIEIYDSGRYACMTGNVLNGYSVTIGERQE